VAQYFIMKVDFAFYYDRGINLKINTLLSATIALVGGTTSNAGHVFARNPRTGFYGPVCDDFFGDVDVRPFRGKF